jgi:SOS-response transcriptional repressor LexA
VERKFDYDEVYAWICDYKKEHDGNSPSLRQIRDHFGMASTNTVRYILKQLSEDGLLDVIDGMIQYY